MQASHLAPPAEPTKDVETQGLISGSKAEQGGIGGWWSWLWASTYATQDEAKKARITRWSLGGLLIALIVLIIVIASVPFGGSAPGVTPAPAPVPVPVTTITWQQVCDFGNVTNKAQAAQQALASPLLRQLVIGVLDAATSNSLNDVFTSWAKDFNVSFDTPDQRAAAVKNFQDNLVDIFKTNTDSKLGHWSGCNQYTSMSFTEFGNVLLTGKMGSDTLEDTGNETSNGGAGGRKLQQTYPPTVDWVAAGKVTAVRNQRKCGSCWAFAGVAAVESLYLMKNPSLSATNLDLSEEQIIECVSNVTINPSVSAPTFGRRFRSGLCTGGWVEEVLDYLTVYGINNEYAAQAYNAATCGRGTFHASYPLNCRTNGTQCPSYLSTAGQSLKIPGYRGRVSPASNEEALKAAVAIRPVTTFFQVGPSFQSYAGGIYTPPTTDCPAAPPFSLNHLMLIVGYDNVNKWWLIKNSWGVGWGINKGVSTGPITGQGGFAKVIMNGRTAGACGLAAQNFWPNPDGAFPPSWNTVAQFPALL